MDNQIGFINSFCKYHTHLVKIGSIVLKKQLEVSRFIDAGQSGI